MNSPTNTVGPISENVIANVVSNQWREVTLGECAELIRDSVSPSIMGEALYIGLEHIGEGTLSLLGQGVATDVTSTKSRFQRGDILFGKLRPYFRKVVRARTGGLCSTDIWVIRGREGVEQGYLHYCIASQQFIDFAMAGSEGTKMPRAIWDCVSRYKISLPPLTKQRTIAHVLGTLDDKIELNRRMNETLEAMARAIFQDWFVDFGPVCTKLEGKEPYLSPELWSLFPDRLVDSELGEIPEGWEVKLLGQLIELAYGKALRADDRRGGPVVVYGSNGQVGWHNKRLVSGPGIVLAERAIQVSLHGRTGSSSPSTQRSTLSPEMEAEVCLFYFCLGQQDLPSISADSAVPGLNRKPSVYEQAACT